MNEEYSFIQLKCNFRKLLYVPTYCCWLSRGVWWWRHDTQNAGWNENE